MPFQLDILSLDVLSADPAFPVNGQIWYNSTTGTVRSYQSGAVKDWGAGASVFGANYQTAISLARSTTTSATMQDKTTLTTGALTGTYRVHWTAVVDVATASSEVQARLYNVTDATVIGVVQDIRIRLTTERHVCSGFAEVVFTGAAKTFKIQFASPNGSTTVGIQDARIELWRVQ